MNVGWNLLNYEGYTRAPTADSITLKLILNSFIGTPNAKHMAVEIKNFYLVTKLKNK